MFRFRLNPGRGQYHTRHRSWWDVSFYCHRPWQHHRNRENTIEICLLTKVRTRPRDGRSSHISRHNGPFESVRFAPKSGYS